MEFILDNHDVEQQYQKILAFIMTRKNGEVSELMAHKGINYKKNWGVSIPELREMAGGFSKNHLLALKLWNKQWRESMIMSTLLDEPDKVSEEQMDFWTKSFENAEIAEQASSNLWVKTRFAFVKSLEWCRGKKHFVRYTGIHLTGRLAILEKEAIDEMFEPFLAEVPVLARDKMLFIPLTRALFAISSRSKYMHSLVLESARELAESESLHAAELGSEVLNHLVNEEQEQ